MIARLEEREEHWHYEGGRRDLRLDLLRGFAAFAMIVDHIGGAESWLYPLTGGNRFLVSAAEAFVFISGAVMGIVYLNVLTKQGLRAALLKALHRAWSLYLVTVLLTVSFAAAAYWLRLSWSPDTGGGGVARWLFDVVTFRKTLYLVDIPLMYTLLLLGACPVIFLLARGHTALVLAGSWAIWLAWQFWPSALEVPWHIENNDVFKTPAWQVLFVTGIVVGWHRAGLEEWFRRLSHPLVLAVLAAVTLIVTGLYVAQMSDLEGLQSSHFLYTQAFDKTDLPIGRLVIFGILAVFSFTLTTLFWQPLRRFSGWLLLPLGQNALTAYSIHVFVVAATTWLSLQLLDGAPGTLASTALQVAGVAVVWTIVRYEPTLKDHTVAKLRAIKTSPSWPRTESRLV